jgi:Zn-dependent M28 family amino/carboxypeptidase
MQEFSRSVGSRPADSWGEIHAREFIQHDFERYGYRPVIQEFIAGEGKDRIHSANVIAVKEGASPRTLVLGAHYDTVPGSRGACDNASGIGVLLEMAGRLAQVDTPYTLVFVAFGAEEEGLYGSLHYLDKLIPQERRNIVGMINLDGLAGLERLYVYGVDGEDSWLRDDILAAADDVGVKLATDEMLQVRPPVSKRHGYTIAGDHVSFALYDIPPSVFISGVDELVVERGIFLPMNTRRDTMAALERQNPGVVADQLRDVVMVLETVLTSELATS